MSLADLMGEGACLVDVAETSELAARIPAILFPLTGTLLLTPEEAARAAALAPLLAAERAAAVPATRAPVATTIGNTMNTF